MLSDYIDIHKHEITSGEGSNVYTIFNKYEMFSSLAPENQYSVGIHPWYINDWETQLENLQQHAMLSNVAAIGECGLDTLVATDFELQTTIFKKQISLANECRKPLIIHCVRAFPQTLLLLKQAKVPVIFHGFNKKLAVANDILKQGYYLSFGKDLLNENSASNAAFANVPADKFFFETDDADLDIKEIYKAGAQIRKTAEDAIILQVKENFKIVFNL